MHKKDIAAIISLASQLVISRDGDVDTEDGSFATVDADCLIELDYTIAQVFGLDSDDVTQDEAWKIERQLERMEK